ncbi:MAG: hypothetical protein AAF937_06140 [Planctomycetota bacterium]
MSEDRARCESAGAVLGVALAGGCEFCECAEGGGSGFGGEGGGAGLGDGGEGRDVGLGAGALGPGGELAGGEVEALGQDERGDVGVKEVFEEGLVPERGRVGFEGGPDRGLGAGFGARFGCGLVGGRLELDHGGHDADRPGGCKGEWGDGAEVADVCG